MVTMIDKTHLVTDAEAEKWEADVLESKLFSGDIVGMLLATRTALIEALEPFQKGVATNQHIADARHLLARLHDEGSVPPAPADCSTCGSKHRSVRVYSPDNPYCPSPWHDEGSEERGMSDELWNGGCGDCAAFFYAPENWMLVGAFASVGIEHGKSTYQMARDFFREYHERGHKR